MPTPYRGRVCAEIQANAREASRHKHRFLLFYLNSLKVEIIGGDHEWTAEEIVRLAPVSDDDERDLLRDTLFHSNLAKSYTYRSRLFVVVRIK